MMPLVILSGPTAVGKTELSINLAKRINAEIISADSMQVYKGMDIGTAKITSSEMQGIKHHLIDVIEPEEEWNVLKFKNMAKKACEEITAAGHIPMLTGGTGFYIQALLYDVDFTEENNDEIRKRLTEEYEKMGSSYLYEKLKKVDPVSAEIIHENNVKRVIRALEFYEMNSFPISEHNKIQQARQSAFNSVYFVLNDEREKIYQRIDMRVDKMIEAGLVDEVDRLMKRGLDLSYVSMQGLGYKEIYRYLTGEITLSDAIYILKRDTRHFAKRQLTWFRREKDVVFVNRNSFKTEDEILQFMYAKIKERNIEC